MTHVKDPPHEDSGAATQRGQLSQDTAPVQEATPEPAKGPRDPLEPPGDQKPLKSSRQPADLTELTKQNQQSTALQSDFQLLSRLLDGIPAEELHLVLDHFEDAVVRGVIKAVPLEGAEPFTVVVVNAQGKRGNRKVEEEIVLPDEPFYSWLKAERKASRLAVLAVSGRVETSLEKLVSGDDSFSKLVEIRRKRLQKSKVISRPSKASS